MKMTDWDGVTWLIVISSWVGFVYMLAEEMPCVKYEYRCDGGDFFLFFIVALSFLGASYCLGEFIAFMRRKNSD